MKISVRYRVFETNSSSIHSCVILSENDYKRWKDENLYVQELNDNGHVKFILVTPEEIDRDYLDEYLEATKDSTRDNYDHYDFEDWLQWDKNLTRHSEFGYDTYGSNYYDSDIVTFVTPSGDVMVAANYYGYDG